MCVNTLLEKALSWMSGSRGALCVWTLHLGFSCVLRPPVTEVRAREGLWDSNSQDRCRHFCPAPVCVLPPSQALLLRARGHGNSCVFSCPPPPAPAPAPAALGSGSASLMRRAFCQIFLMAGSKISSAGTGKCLFLWGHSLGGASRPRGGPP